MRRMLTIVAALAAPTLCPEAGFAQQGSITGTVTDGAGVLPGVTIEASRPDLAEPRVAHTDAVGSYSLADLPAGVWTLTFELPGFSTESRDRELPADSIVTVDVELPVAGRNEIITVPGSLPSVGITIGNAVRGGSPPRPVLTSRPIGVTITNTPGHGGGPVPPVRPRNGVTVTNTSTGGPPPAAPGDRPGRGVTIRP